MDLGKIVVVDSRARPRGVVPHGTVGNRHLPPVVDPATKARVVQSDMAARFNQLDDGPEMSVRVCE